MSDFEVTATQHMQIAVSLARIKMTESAHLARVMQMRPDAKTLEDAR